MNGQISAGRLNPYSFSANEVVWAHKDNYSTYYDYETDTQCRVPIRDIHEVRQELEARFGDSQSRVDTVQTVAAR